MLISHILLAAAIVPLAIMTLNRALRGRFDAHRRIALWTWPIWIYVSVTGVLVYLLVYQIYGPPILPTAVASIAVTNDFHHQGTNDPSPRCLPRLFVPCGLGFSVRPWH